MDSSTQTYARPEAMGDVPGICELRLTRAIVQYRDAHEMDAPGGRIEDIGLALVVEGRYAASAEVIDLGSGRLKVLDLSTELVVLDWVYEPTLDHVASLITATAATRDEGSLQQYSFKLGIRILERVGFGPLTRPTFLRIGYRDICRDLDLHEGTSIRFVLGPGRLTRVHLDYDACALVFKTAFGEPDGPLEHALSEAFPSAEVCRFDPVWDTDSIEYRVRLPLPTTFVRADGPAEIYSAITPGFSYFAITVANSSSGDAIADSSPTPEVEPQVEANPTASPVAVTPTATPDSKIESVISPTATTSRPMTELSGNLVSSERTPTPTAQVPGRPTITDLTVGDRFAVSTPELGQFIVLDRINVLVGELLRRKTEDLQLWVFPQHIVADGVQQVRFAKPHPGVKKQGVVGAPRRLGHGQGRRPR